MRDSALIHATTWGPKMGSQPGLGGLGRRSLPGRKAKTTPDSSCWTWGIIGQAVNGTPAKFPKTAHLLKHADFQRVYQNGRRHFSGNMTVFFLGREVGARGARVGFTVGRVLGKSVDRNRIRRRTREAVRMYMGTLADAGVAVDIVINPKRSVLQVEFAELRKEIESAFAVVRQRLSPKKLSETSKGGASV